MSTETPGEVSNLVVKEEHHARAPSLRGVKQAFFVASGIGSLTAIVPTVMGPLTGYTEVYSSVLTATFAAVSLGIATIGFVSESMNKSNCSTDTILIGAHAIATIATEVASISVLVQNPNLFAGMAVVGGAVMNGSLAASGALSCVRK